MPIKVDKPATELVRRAVLIEWLGKYGISAADADELMNDGTLKKVKLRPKARAYYRTEEVVAKILKPMGLN